jgi:type IV pilus assembly protein PilB
VQDQDADVEKVLIDLGVPQPRPPGWRSSKGSGCCLRRNGYKGRIALYEVMPFTESVKELVLNGTSSQIKGPPSGGHEDLR